MNWLAFLSLAAFPSLPLCPECPEPPLVESSVLVEDPRLLSRLRDLEQRSAQFRSGMKQLRETHLPVVITTPARLKEHYPQVEYSPVFGPAVVLPYPGPGPSNEVAFVLVIVESDRMADIYRAHEVPDAVLNEDLSRILGHELYTHVIPLSRSRRVEDICPDPRLEDVLAGRMLRGCSVERENELREDLGLPPRSTYLDSGLEFEEGALDLFVLQARQAGYSEEDILRVQSWMREVNRRNASLSAPGG